MCRSLFTLTLVAGCFPRIDPADVGTDVSSGDADTDTDSDTDADSDSDTDTDPGDPRITAISPEDGSTAGGSVVTIAGSGFTASTRVWFGADEADVTHVSGTALTVESPAHARGPVDVSVGVSDGTDSLDSAFTYWTDASGDTELVVLWGYLASYDGSGYAYGLAYPTEPAPFSFYELWGTGLDVCDDDGDVTTATWGDQLVVTDEDGGRYTLAEDGGSYTYAGTTSGTEYSAGTSYGISGPTSSSTPAFALDPFFVAPAAFTVTSPAIAHDYDFYFSGTDLDVAWSGSAGDFVLVWMLGQDSGSSLYCVARDDGDFTVDSRYMSRFDLYEFVQLSVARFRVSESVLPHDNGVVLGAGMYQFTGFVQVY
jgi:hypothetical protein